MKTSKNQTAKQLNFKSWSKLMNVVYSDNSNGKWAILFAIICCFRKLISNEIGFFPSLFFIGPCGTGKTSIATSIRSIFENYFNPAFNLNTGTDAEFFRLLEKNENSITIMDEYNDNSITKLKFQGLKCALDSENITKLNQSAPHYIDVTEINSTPLIIGQYIPTKDDYSLFIRVVLCEIPYKEFSQSEKMNFGKLKEFEFNNAINILPEIVLVESKLNESFASIYNSELQKFIIVLGYNPNNRILKSVALFSAICLFIEEKTELKLPFTYANFFKIACEKIELSKVI